MNETRDMTLGTNKPPLTGDIIVKKKRSHDLAYLVIILAILFGTFLFAMMVVNNLLRTIG
jgi:hypothetical protein